MIPTNKSEGGVHDENVNSNIRLNGKQQLDLQMLSLKGIYDDHENVYFKKIGSLKEEKKKLVNEVNGRLK